MPSVRLSADSWRLRAPRPGDLVERCGGLLVSSAIGALAFVLLQITVLSIPRVAETLGELRVRLAPEPEPETVPVEPLSQPMIEELAATSVNPADIDDVRSDAAEGAEAMLAMAKKGIEGWMPRTDDERRRLEAVVSGVRDLGDIVEVEETDAKAEVNRRAVESAGREFLLNSDGGRSGVVRTIDVSSFPEDLVVRVLARYGISIEFREVEVDGETRSFLNSATTEKGTFTSVRQGGFYQVFVMSPKALSMMSAMELRAMQERGHDPLRTRVRKVVFGIVKDDEFGDYGLGVTELEVERVR